MRCRFYVRSYWQWRNLWNENFVWFLTSVVQKACDAPVVWFLTYALLVCKAWCTFLPHQYTPFKSRIKERLHTSSVFQVTISEVEQTMSAVLKEDCEVSGVLLGGDCVGVPEHCCPHVRTLRTAGMARWVPGSVHRNIFHLHVTVLLKWKALWVLYSWLLVQHANYLRLEP